MPNPNLFSSIQAKYETFTKAERKVADYTLKHPDEVLYMSITDLADLCRVGETSVFRFCRTLALQGYQEFKMVLAQSLSSQGNAFSQFVGQINASDTPDEVAKKLLDANVAALKESYKFIRHEDVAKAVDYMKAAKRISFLGVGSSMITALEAANEFLRITPKVDCTIDSHLQTMRASLLSSEDLAVIISYSGSTKDIVEMAKVCRATGVKVICITRYAKSPLTEYSDLTLLCGSNEGPLQGGSVCAKISQLYLINVLYNEYFIRTLDESKLNKKKTANAVLQKLY